MQATVDDIHLAVCFDQGYVPFVYVLLASAFHHNADSRISIHAIAPAILPADGEAITQFVEQRGGRIYFYALAASATQGFALPNHKTSYFTLANYYRLFFADLVPQSLSKLLYIDIDTLVVGSLKDLFLTDLGGFALGAVHDTEMHLRTDLGLTKREDYFNSGVLLINLPQWRLQGITERACDIAVRYPEKVKGWVDQDALNLLLQGNWYRLDSRYNLMNGFIPHDLPQRNYEKFLTDKVIVHYSGSPKAWDWACENKLRFLYKRYSQQLPASLAQHSAGKGMPWQGLTKLLASRALETYFNHPEVGQAWRRLKTALKG